MKKALAIVALVAAMFVAGNAQAQMIYATYAPETFVRSSNTNYQGFSIGFTQNIELYKNLGLGVGAQFRMNLRSDTETVWGFTGKISETQTIIDVPILLNYQIKLNNDFSITPFVGPMLSVALSGTTKGVDPIFGDNIDNWYDSSSNLNRFNLYAAFGLDINFSDFNLFGGYRLGLLDLDRSDNVSLKTNGFFVGIGLSF